MIAVIQPNEIKIDTWSILYMPTTGEKYSGKLTITNKRLLYDTKPGASAKKILPAAFVTKWVSEGYLEINKANITDIQVEKSLLNKKVTLVLSDGSRHTFCYGALNIDKVVEAIRSS